MNKRIVIAGVVLLVAFCLLLWMFHEDQSAQLAEPTTIVKEAKPSIPTPLVGSKFGREGTDAQIPPAAPGKYDPTLPQWQEWRRRNEVDKKWEWRTPITFYGCVLDQNDQPVVGAKVTLSWTDLSLKGTSLRELQTDGAGNFTLNGVQGKHLLVRSIERAGYEYATTNRNGFEYSAFFEEEYHIPNPANRVIFRMHRKVEGASLVTISDKFKIQSDETVAINLRTGKQDKTTASFVVELVDNSDPTGRKWAARISAPGGGLQPANDEFATVAPEEGYVPEIGIDQDTPQPGGFQSGTLYKGGKFYVKTSSGYALVEFRMIPGNKSIRVTSYLNPSGSRNLEFDDKKQINR